MQSKLIIVEPSISKIWLSIIGVLIVLSVVCWVYFDTYLLVLFVLVYIPIYFLCQTNYQLQIRTDQKQFAVKRCNKLYDAKLIDCYQVSFLLTFITLEYAHKIVTFPIFIDSIEINEYKNLRVFLQWS